MESVPDAVTMSLLLRLSPTWGPHPGLPGICRTVAARLSGPEKAADELVKRANQSHLLNDIYIDGLLKGSLMLNVDRGKSGAMGVSFDEINQTISVATGSSYVNDYTNNGRVQQVNRSGGCAPPYATGAVVDAVGEEPLGADASFGDVCDALLERCPTAAQSLSRDIRPSAYAEAPRRANPRVAQ